MRPLTKTYSSLNGVSDKKQFEKRIDNFLNSSDNDFHRENLASLIKHLNQLFKRDVIFSMRDKKK